MSDDPNAPVGRTTTRAPFTGTRPLSSRVLGVGVTLMCFLLLVAIIFAANQNDVIGWLVVIISALWLVLGTAIFLSVRGAARKASEKLEAVRAQFSAGQNDGDANRTSSASKSGTPTSGTANADAMRDEKLAHSFKILQVQGRVIKDELAKTGGADLDVVSRALDTIQITAHNGMGMLKKQTPGEPVEGEIVD